MQHTSPQLQEAWLKLAFLSRINRVLPAANLRGGREGRQQSVGLPVRDGFAQQPRNPYSATTVYAKKRDIVNAAPVSSWGAIRKTAPSSAWCVSG
jgi:hypothetical protein